MSADTSTISTPYIVFVWLFALVLFFAAVFSLAKSDTPGRDLISFFAFTSSWEGALLWGAISLFLHYADKSRADVDELDVADADKAGDNLNDKDDDNGVNS